MRKQHISMSQPSQPSDLRAWIDLQSLAVVEVTSEDDAHPIEGALVAEPRHGWRASVPGQQLLRLRFDRPVHLRHLQLVFQESNVARTQEFVLRWSADNETYRDIVRQQYTFSPTGTTIEVEDYIVDLPGARVLELSIKPDIGGAPVHASMASLRLAGS